MSLKGEEEYSMSLLCSQTTNTAEVCMTCGVRAGTLHRPLLKGGRFCGEHCTVCSPAAPVVPEAKAASVFVDAPVDDPWRRDTEADRQARSQAPRESGWFPARRKFFS